MRRKQLQSSSDTSENVAIAELNPVEEDTESRDQAGPRKVDKENQVDFLEEYNHSFDNSKVFICNRYVNSNICDSETQTYLPNKSKIHLKDIVTKAKTADKSCGSSSTFEDKSVGPDINEVDSTGLLTCQSGFHGASSIKTDQEMLDLAGVTLHTYNFLLKVLSDKTGPKISKQNRLLIFLVKMKCGLTYSALGVLFNIHRTSASRIFISTLQYLAMACKNFVVWPSREIVQATMPQVFKESYKDCRVIIDCTEIRVEQPSSVERRVQFYSHYNKGFTIKVLIGCTPGGLVSFVSKCYGGRTSDSQITNNCGFLDFLEPGDMILADKSFPGIKSTIDENGQGIILVMPPFLRDGQFSEEHVNETYSIASVRIHIERIMQRLRTHRILTKFTLNMLPFADDILFMCAVLVNSQPPILKDSDSENV